MGTELLCPADEAVCWFHQFCVLSGLATMNGHFQPMVNSYWLISGNGNVRPG